MNNNMYSNKFGKKSETLLLMIHSEAFHNLVPKTYVMEGNILKEFFQKNEVINEKLDCYIHEIFNSDDGNFKADNLLEAEIISCIEKWLHESKKELIESIIKVISSGDMVVRSSGLEDLDGSINAGGNLSVLDVRSENLVRAIAEVYGSYYSDKSLRQLLVNELSDKNMIKEILLKKEFPVIIQEMIKSSVKRSTDEYPLIDENILRYISDKTKQLKLYFSHDVSDTEWVIKSDQGIISVVAFSNEPYYGSENSVVSCSFGVGTAVNRSSLINSVDYIVSDEAVFYSGDELSMAKKVKVEVEDIFLVQCRNSIKRSIKTNNLSNFNQFKNKAKIFNCKSMYSQTGDSLGKVIVSNSLNEAWNNYLKLSQCEREEVKACCIMSGSPLEHAGIMFQSEGVSIAKIGDKDFIKLLEIHRSNNNYVIAYSKSSIIYVGEENIQPVFKESFLSPYYMKLDKFQLVGLDTANFHKSNKKNITYEKIVIFEEKMNYFSNRLNLYIAKYANIEWFEANSLKEVILETESILALMTKEKEYIITIDTKYIFNIIEMIIKNLLIELKELSDKDIKSSDQFIRNNVFKISLINTLLNGDLDINNSISIENINSLLGFHYRFIEIALKEIDNLDTVKKNSDFGERFNWILEKSIFYRRQKQFAESGYITKNAELEEFFKLTKHVRNYDLYNFYTRFSSNLNRDLKKIWTILLNRKFDINMVNKVEFIYQNIQKGSFEENDYGKIVNDKLSETLLEGDLLVAKYYIYFIRMIVQFGGDGDLDVFHQLLTKNPQFISSHIQELMLIELDSKDCNFIDVNEIIEKYDLGIIKLKASDFQLFVNKLMNDIKKMENLVTQIDNICFNGLIQNIIVNMNSNIIELFDIWAKVNANALANQVSTAYENYLSVLNKWVGIFKVQFRNITDKYKDDLIRFIDTYCLELEKNKSSDLKIDVDQMWYSKIYNLQEVNIHELHNVLHQSSLYYFKKGFKYILSDRVKAYHESMITFNLKNRAILRNQYRCVEVELGLGDLKLHKSSIIIRPEFIIATYTEAPDIKIGRLMVLKEMMDIIDEFSEEYKLISTVVNKNGDNMIHLKVTTKNQSAFNWNQVQEISQIVRALFDGFELGGNTKEEIARTMINKYCKNNNFKKFIKKYVNYHKYIRFTDENLNMGGGIEKYDVCIFQSILALITLYNERFEFLLFDGYEKILDAMNKNLLIKEYLGDSYTKQEWLGKAYSLILAILYPKEVREDLSRNRNIIGNNDMVRIFLEMTDAL